MASEITLKSNNIFYTQYLERQIVLENNSKAVTSKYYFSDHYFSEMFSTDSDTELSISKIKFLCKPVEGNLTPTKTTFLFVKMGAKQTYSYCNKSLIYITHIFQILCEYTCNV